MLLRVFTVYLPYKLLGNISDLHELSLGLGLVIYLFIVITIISTGTCKTLQ